MRASRIRLLPPDPTRTELQRDALRALEHSLSLRGMHRKGDIIDVPLTIGHVQKMLARTGARRKGNHYARACLRELAAMQVIQNTGRILTPKRQTSLLRSKWWRVYRVIPVYRSIRASIPGAYGYPTPSLLLTGSLLSFLRCQGFGRAIRTGAKGSPQAAFHALGPP